MGLGTTTRVPLQNEVLDWLFQQRGLQEFTLGVVLCGKCSRICSNAEGTVRALENAIRKKVCSKEAPAEEYSSSDEGGLTENVECSGD